MLYTRHLHGMPVETPVGEVLGKLDGLIVDIRNWKVDRIVVSPGTFRKNSAYDLADVESFDEETMKLYLRPEATAYPVPDHSTHEAMFLRDLMWKNIYTADKKRLKSLYDVDIATQLKHWDLWKLLIQTPLKRRRLRISPSDIEKVADTITLSLTMSTIEKREAAAEAGREDEE